MSGDQDETMAAPTHVTLTVEQWEHLSDDCRLLQVLTQEHNALLQLVGAVASAYSPEPGIVLDEDGDTALTPLLDAAGALADWCADHHPDWQDEL